LDGSNVGLNLSTSSAFQLSESEETGFSESLNLTAYDGTVKTIYVRLAAGLAAGNYNDNITISGGDAPETSVSLSGTVQMLPVIANAVTTGTVGQNFYYEIEATGNPDLFTLVSGALPVGLTLDVDNGIISGLPAEAGNFNVQITATNAAGLSAP